MDLAVGILTVLNGQDLELAGGVAKAGAVDADAQAILRRVYAFELAHIAFARGGEAGQGVQDAQRRGLRDGALLRMGGGRDG